MNQWTERETYITEMNLNKDFHYENKTIENNESANENYLTELADKILNNKISCYPKNY